jgi:hypothetical protein
VGPAVGRRAPEAEAERWRRAGGGHGRAGRRRPAGRKSPHKAPAKGGRRSRAGASAGAEVASRGAGRAGRHQARVGAAGRRSSPTG